MNDELERILDQILEAHQLGEVDPAPWMARYPAYASEIADIVDTLKFAPRHSEVREGPWSDSGGVAAKAIADLVAQAAWRGEELIDQLGRDLESFRAREREHGFLTAGQRGHRVYVVYLWTVNALLRRAAPATRWPVSKDFYLLDRGLSLGLARHTRHRRGMFDPQAAYATERRAKQKGDLRVQDYSYAILPLADRLWSEAEEYLGSVGLAERLLDVLAARDEFELETWTTVEHVVTTQIPADDPVTLERVRAAIAAKKEWGKEKLEQPNFRDDRILEALRLLSRLRFIRPDRVRF